MKHIVKYIFAILFMALLMITNKVIVNAEVPSTFNVMFEDSTKGYFYYPDYNTTNFYELYYNNQVNVPNAFSYNINSFETINNNIVPLSFVDFSTNSSGNYCSGVGCNVAYSIPVEFSYFCDSSYCGLSDYFYDYHNNPTGTLTPNVMNINSNIKLSDLPNYFDASYQIEYLYYVLTNNTFQFLYYDLDNTLKSSNAFLSPDNTYIAVYSNATQDYLRVYTYDVNSSPKYRDFIILYGTVLNNQFSDIKGLRFYANYPFSLDRFNSDFNFHFGLTNFNFNTTILSGVTPDFPDSPNVDINDLIIDYQFSDSELNSFLDRTIDIIDNSPIYDLFMLVPDFLNTLDYGVRHTTCTSIDLGNLMGTHLVLPCFNISDILGSDLTSIIDLLFCFGLILYARKLIVSVWHHIMSLDIMRYLNDNMNDGLL